MRKTLDVVEFPSRFISNYKNKITQLLKMTVLVTGGPEYLTSEVVIRSGKWVMFM
jgi:hypothetical protein